MPDREELIRQLNEPLQPVSPGLAEWSEKPLVTFPTRVARDIGDRLTEPSLDRGKTEAQLRGFLAGALEGIGNLLTDATIPSEAAIPFPIGKKVFHGSPFRFKEFDPSMTDKQDTLGSMMHFAENPRYAETYTGQGLNVSKTHPYIDRTEFPESPNIRVSELDVDQALDIIDNFSSEDVKRLLEAGFPMSVMSRVIDVGPRERAALVNMILQENPDMLRKAGYQAIRYQDLDEPAWAVFDPTREKLETFVNPDEIGSRIPFESRINPETDLTSHDPLDLEIPEGWQQISPGEKLSKSLEVLNESPQKPFSGDWTKPPKSVAIPEGWEEIAPGQMFKSAR